MLLKTTAIINTSIGTLAPIKVNDDVEFRVVCLEWNNYQVQNVKGNFELTKITYYNVNFYGEIEIKFKKEDYTFFVDKSYPNNFSFYIDIEINFQEIVTYDLHVDYNSCRALKPLQFFVQNIILPERGIFKCYIKYVNEKFIEIHVVNPTHVIINDQTEDYRCVIESKEFMRVMLTFIFN